MGFDVQVCCAVLACASYAVFEPLAQEEWYRRFGKALHYTNKAHEEFLKRQNEIIAGVAEFAQANDLTEQERMAVEAMFRFHQGDQHWLITGRGIIEHMIAAENERKQQQAHAAQQQIDEAMETKENLNA